jgi:hypothetical protein
MTFLPKKFVGQMLHSYDTKTIIQERGKMMAWITREDAVFG